MRESLKEVLMRRDSLSSDEADSAIESAQADLYECLKHGNLTTAEEIVSDHFGLEPDYLDDLI